LIPTLLPFFFHWYSGFKPPVLGVAVKVTLVPVVMIDDGDTLTATVGTK